MQNTRILRNEKEKDFDYYRIDHLRHIANSRLDSQKFDVLHKELSQYVYTEKRDNIISALMDAGEMDDPYHLILEQFMMRYPNLMEHKNIDGKKPVDLFYDLAEKRQGKVYTQNIKFFLAAIALGYDVKDNISDKRYAQIMEMICDKEKNFHSEILASVMISFAEEIEFEFKVSIPFCIAWESGKFYKDVLNCSNKDFTVIEILRGYYYDKSKAFWKKFNTKLQSLWPLANRYITTECQTVHLFFKLANFTNEELHPLSERVMWYAKNVRLALKWDAGQSVVKLLCSKNIGTIDSAAEANMPDVLSYLLAKLNEVRPLENQAGIINQELSTMLEHKDVDVQTIQMLMHYDANIHNISRCMTPLMLASRTGNLKVVEFLLKNSVDVNARESTTALMHAAEFGYTDVMRLLIEYGANLYAEKLNKHNALYIAIINNQFDAAILLLQSDSALRYSSSARKKSIVNILNYATDVSDEIEPMVVESNVRGFDCGITPMIAQNDPIKSLQLFRDQFAKLQNILASTGLNIVTYKYLNTAEFFVNKGYKTIAQILESLENYAQQVHEPGNFALLFKLYSWYTHEELHALKMDILNSVEDYEVGSKIVSSILDRAYQIVKEDYKFDDLSIL